MQLMGATPARLIDTAYQLAFNIAYRLHLIWAFLFRPQSHGVWVAAWYNGDVLLVKNSSRSTLTLPGGGIGKGESRHAAALRELSEEVGIVARSSDLVYWGEYRSTVEYKLDHINVYEIELSHLPQIRLDNREVSWADLRSPEQALDMQLFPALRSYLIDKQQRGFV